MDSTTTTISSISNGIFMQYIYTTQTDQINNENPFKTRLYQLHKIKEASPSDRADPREINFITFIGKINLERMTYYDIKVII
ncbi:unnamed protein product [Rotaria sp. Silwood2]|nr:unnamed protein product [Rotaria sp. Silwood2]CAF2875826.1 unnamed protein product [Rotaria sp. Silwood2]CAF4169247.1 unnamed protein product [Rotaria sp. Silwood2]CAF4691641.1 unnamed protein product [Rotaria sp. Silwood2]